MRIFVNRLNSEHSVIPYEYHYFDFCTVPDEYESSPVENLGIINISRIVFITLLMLESAVAFIQSYVFTILGQVVFGDRMRPSPYLLDFSAARECVSVCRKEYNLKDAGDQEKLRKLKSGISLNYQHHWIVDNLPITWCYQVPSINGDGSETYCSTGFPMGCYVSRDGAPRYPCPIQSEV